MKHYEAIKQMNLNEMTGTLFAFILPWIKEDTETEKILIWKQIENFLNSEVKSVGDE